MTLFSRRSFLKRAAVGGAIASFTISGTKASGRVLGANDRVRVAIAGIHGQGQRNITYFGGMKDVEIAYLIDPDSRLFDSRSKAAEQRSGILPTCVQDFRYALDDKNLDAIAIVTPNHWHSPMGILACQAGKDVYVEKPCCHNIAEGRKLVEAARKYDRIVQHGTQRRSDPQWIQLIDDVRKGKYGKLLISYAYTYQSRGSIGNKDPQDPPRGLDYNLWLGPAPVQPFRTNLVHYHWHWVWDFGDGEQGNQGSHQFDIARWALPDGAVPKSVLSLGGRFGYKDQGQTPNTQLTMIDCGATKVVFEIRGLVDNKKQRKVTNEFHTDEGVVRGDKFFPKGKSEGVPIANAPYQSVPRQGPEHMRNFIDCVRSRNRENLNAEILEGHRSIMLVHLGNISYRLGEDVPFNKKTKAFQDDKTFCDAFEGMKQHLADDARLDLTDGTYRLGRTLRFDAQTENFIDAPDANELLSRRYREPFTVPDCV